MRTRAGGRACGRYSYPPPVAGRARRSCGAPHQGNRDLTELSYSFAASLPIFSRDCVASTKHRPMVYRRPHYTKCTSMLYRRSFLKQAFRDPARQDRHVRDMTLTGECGGTVSAVRNGTMHFPSPNPNFQRQQLDSLVRRALGLQPWA